MNRIAELEAALSEQESLICDLQHALYFWLPGVPENDDSEIARRIGHDAMLLAPWYSPEDPGKSAKELGLIALSASDHA